MPQDRQPDAEAMRAAIRERMAGAAAAGQNTLAADAIMRRIHAELGQRSGALRAGHGVPYALERWQPAAPRLPIKREYVLAELLSFDDADFVDHAYRSILRRAPDEAGHGYFLRALREGRLSKIEVLGELRWSAEGQARSVHVDGLLLPYKLHTWRRRKIVGPVLGLLHSLWRLRSLPAKLAASDAAHAREAQELGHFANRLAAQLEHHLQNLEASLKNEIAQLSSNEALERAVARAVDGLGEDLRAELRNEADALKDAQAGLRESVVDVAGEVRLLSGNLAAQKAELEALANPPRGANLDALYAEFEDEFRGSEALVKQRLQPYLDTVREVSAAAPAMPVVDLGAGRGEWLKMLREAGIAARGVDTNEVFLAHAREQGLDVIGADAIEALANMPDASANVVTSMHLVEHLPFERMISMLDESLRVLRVGGMLILETPNPENLGVASLGFYIDPTHRNPIPPQTLAWIVGARGYKDVSLMRLSEARELTAPPFLGNDMPAAGVVNTLVSHYHAAPDYAVIAWKK